MAVPQTLAVGTEAPDFSLPASTGGELHLSDFRGKQPVVLYFYPKDDTPGCTQEACSFRDLSSDFARAGVAILGVSPQDLASHAKFADKHRLNFPLLFDADGQVATQYGAYGEKSRYGRTYVGNYRVTYLLDQAGKIAAVWPEVTVEGHADEVLAAAAKLES